mmetsp:Transcript_16786/g.24469  ORF Transcript_16786/g.24469 Transcript_16786/m.24469 type:complete len:158 (+) Transcript_16786:3-476(+)
MVQPMIDFSFSLNRDEFDAHMPGSITVHTALKLFERSRSNYLGGPDKLRQMQEEDGLLWVVTSVDDMQIYSHKKKLKPGQSVNVKSTFETKRRGMIIECRQRIETPENVGYEKGGTLIAEGVISLCAIDRKRGRPMSKVPDHVRAIIERNTDWITQQ